MTSKETAAWLAARNNFLILTHLRPDGDCLCSAAGLCQGLREAGKTAWLLQNPETAARSYAAYMEPYCAPADFVPSVVLSVDTAAENMFQINAGAYQDRTELCIDHHASNTGYAAETCLAPERAACGELIYDILLALSGGISEKTATLLYVALSTDTGCFCYGNTNAQTLLTAARLVEAGAPNARLNKELFRTKRRQRLALECRLFAELALFMDDTVALVQISLSLLRETGADEADMEDIAALPGQIAGVVVSVTLREMEDGCSKLSVRTTGQADANAICGRLGGGGHKMAAGCTVNAGLAEARRLILEAIAHEWHPDS